LLQFAGKFLGENWENIGGGSWQGNGASGRGAWQEWQQLTTSLVHICGFVCRKTERAAEQEHLAKWLNGPKVKGERLKGGRWPGRNMLRIIIAKLQIAQRKCRGTGAEAVKDLEERDGLLSVHRLQWSAPIGFKAHLPQHTL